MGAFLDEQLIIQRDKLIAVFPPSQRAALEVLVAGRIDAAVDEACNALACLPRWRWIRRYRIEKWMDLLMMVHIAYREGQR